MKQKPVIFIAFANESVENTRYLRNLSKEQRGIRSALHKAKQAGLCEIVERFNAAIGDILDIFQDEAYNDRIAIFHYGGHANCYSILLKTFDGISVPANKEGLVSFFARQKGLKLIFLNACSTQQHVVDLKSEGIPSVIGTSQDIDDEVATNLAIRFYKGIANGLSLERAWQEAEDDIKIHLGPYNFNDMYWHGKQEQEDRFPWSIYFKEGAELVKQWNLPDEADNPLFGLPEIPGTYGLPESPFLFLRRYEEKYARVFFGRGFYIRGLYNRVNDKKSPPIMLFCGQSGVGKSSLLQAGLIPRLRGTHRVIYTVRNRQKGLLGTLEDALGKHLIEENAGDSLKNKSLKEKWKSVAAKTEQPLVIIIDQAEEIYINPNPSLPNELNDFLEALQLIFSEPGNCPAGKMILAYRKEYHPEIDERFAGFRLSRSYLFLEPLNRKEIIEAIMGIPQSSQLRQRYRDLEIEPDLPGIIADDLLEDKNSPIAPVLQILLTKMWCMSIKENSHHAEFTVKMYQQLRRQGIAMEDFLKQQMAELREWDRDIVNSGLALDVLTFHTTKLGTSRTRDIKEIQQTYQNSQDTIDRLVRQLKHLYLLVDVRNNKNQTRLAHDTLAAVIIKEYNDSDKPGQRAARILAAKSKNFEKGKQKPYLDETDLTIVEQGQPGMRALNPMETKLIEESKKQIEKRKRRIKAYKITGMVLIVLVIMSAVFAIWQWKEALSRTKIITAHYLVSQAQLKVDKDPTAALGLAEKAWNLNKNDITTAALYKIYRENSFYKIIARLEQEAKSAVFSGDGQYIIAGFYDGTIRCWNLQGEEKTRIQRQFLPPTGQNLFINILKNLAKKTSFGDDASKERHQTDREWVGGATPLFEKRFRHLQKLFIKSTGDGIVRLWDKKGSRYLEFTGHEDQLCSYAFSLDEKYILTGSLDHTARLWDLKGNQLQVFKGHEGAVTSAAFSPDMQYILTSSTDKTLRLWELKDRELKCFAGHSDGVYSAGFSPEGTHILTGSKDGTLRLWDMKGTQLKVFDSHKGNITSADFSPGGNYVLAGFKDGTVCLWDLEGKKTSIFKAHKFGLVSVIFSADGKYILTGSYDKTARLWDLAGKQLQTFKGHNHRVTSAVFSPDSRYILTGSYDKTARLWDLKGNIVTIFRGHKNWVTSVAFSSEGKYILTGSYDTTARMWDLKGNERQCFKGHENIVCSVVFSPGGQYILTGSFDKTARLWDLKGNQLQIFKGHEYVVHSAVFSPDSQYVLTGSFDGTVRLWRIMVWRASK